MARETQDRRPALAAAAVLLLFGLAVAVVLGQAPSRPAPTAPPMECVRLWNSSRGALVAGYHNFHSHSYREAEVRRLNGAGAAVGVGRCTVIFPARELDREPRAAAKVLRGGVWRPLLAGAGVSEAHLSELQFQALEGANTVLRPDGTLVPID
jgi:hypothetical protein